MPAASRSLSLLGKRKSAAQLVNQERVLQKRQRLAHVEEAVNVVSTVRPLFCSHHSDSVGVPDCSKLVLSLEVPSAQVCCFGWSNFALLAHVFTL